EYTRGLAFAFMGRDGDALPVYEAASRLAETGGDLDCLSEALHAVALIYEERGEFEQCKRYAERALTAAQRLGDPVLIAALMVRLGASAFFSGHWDQARRCYEQAQAIHHQIDLAPTLCAHAGVLLDLGRLRLAEGDWEEASHYLEESSTVFERWGWGQRVALRVAQSLLAE